MLRTTFLGILLVSAAACGPSTTEPARVDTTGAALDETPPPPPPPTVEVDTTRRGGGTIGSGT
jgi:hypothetical protein